MPNSHTQDLDSTPPTGPTFDRGGAFWPELGDKSPSCLFNTQYLYRGYSVYWREEHDDLARKTLKAHRIRAKNVELRTEAEHQAAKRLGCSVYSALITSSAHSKLREAGLCAITVLLD